MKCEHVSDIMPDYLAGELDSARRQELEAHLRLCDGCRHDVRNLSAIWANLSLLPEEQPSDALRVRFDAMLEAYKQGMAQGQTRASVRDALNQWLGRWWPRQPLIQFALSGALLIAGFAIGLKVAAPAAQEDDITELRSEFHNMQQLVTLTLLQQQSATGRLQGVSWSYRVMDPGQQVINALIQTLNYDPNVNVRLASAEALYQFSERSEVREAMVLALAKEQSPIVQVALIDLLVSLQRKEGALQVLEQLAESAQADSVVSQRARRGVEILRKEN